MPTKITSLKRPFKKLTFLIFGTPSFGLNKNALAIFSAPVFTSYNHI